MAGLVITSCRSCRVIDLRVGSQPKKNLRASDRYFMLATALHPLTPINSGQVLHLPNIGLAASSINQDQFLLAMSMPWSMHQYLISYLNCWFRNEKLATLNNEMHYSCTWS